MMTESIVKPRRKAIPLLERKYVNTTLHNSRETMQNSRGYLDFLFAELAPIVFISFRLLPDALSSLQVIVEIISVLNAMFHPHTIGAT